MSDSRSAVVELLPIDDLDREIVSLSMRINAATYELLVLIRQFDERAGWVRWGFENCTEWLHWRCDLSMNAAREKVRVAHALKLLPTISAEFSNGELTYSKVRAHSRRSLSVHHDDSRGTMSFHIELPTELGQLVHSDGRSGLPVQTVKRLCCDGHTIAIVEDEQGNPLNVSRKTRVIPKAIERALWARDKHCRFPGCQHKRYVAGHHIEHWAHGGETSLENLMLLCSRHHRLVHEGGFRIDKDYKDRWCFYRPDGIAVPRCGYHASDMTDDDVDEVTNAVNNPPHGGLLSDVDRLRNSAAPPI